MTWFFLLLPVVLLLIYMARPRFLRRRLSAARFFSHLPPPREKRSRVKWARPPLSRSLLLQLLVLLLLLTALLLAGFSLGVTDKKEMGVWIVVDTSASMSTRQSGETRIELAKRAVESLMSHLESRSNRLNTCFRLSVLDMERRDLLTSPTGEGVRRVLDTLESRPLGTDLGAIRGLLKQQITSPSSECGVTHLVVVTDCPAPEWAAEPADLALTWMDIAEPVNNTGITSAHALRDPLTGLVREVEIELTAYGRPPKDAKLSISTDTGAKIQDSVIKWRKDGTGTVVFVPTAPGMYGLELSPGGNYDYDDTAMIRVGDGTDIRVDWRLPDRRWLDRLGWKEETNNPHVLIVSKWTPSLSAPALVVGNSFARRVQKETEIRDFIERSPLLDDVNLDVVESLRLPGFRLPDGFQPVLRGMDGRVWLAWKEESPPAVMVPGLPVGTGDIGGRFSVTVFFNALRWLLKERPLEPLYTLTHPGAPEPESNRLVLHEGEGNTWKESRSLGSIQQLQTTKTSSRSLPFWPVPLFAAILLFAIERILSFTP